MRASRTLAVEDPACGIHWSQLAGIGRIESLHGYFGTSTLDADGNTTEDIRGLALDGRILSGGGGTGSTPDPTGRTQETSGVKRLALIRDSDNGVLDGDQIFDRAVGPMQFIPSTWRLYDADGNDDGETDPQNVYDAALASAHYLCDAPGSMQSHDGEQRAYFAYNHDLDYSRNVTNAGRRYQAQLNVAPESRAFATFAATPVPQTVVAVVEDEPDEVDTDEADRDESVPDESDNSETNVDPAADDGCLLYTSPSPRDRTRSRMPSSA